MLAAALFATVLCVLVQQARRVELAESSRSFVDNFLSKSKNTGRSEHAYVKSWVQQVKRGGLFGKLHSYEHKVQHSRKMRKDRALAGITEPMGSHEMLDSLMRTRSRAVGGESSRKGADALQRRTDKQFGANDGGHRHEDFGAYRRHADAVAVVVGLAEHSLVCPHPVNVRRPCRERKCFRRACRRASAIRAESCTE